MYSLLVSGSDRTWDASRWECPRSRFLEYTAESIKNRFASLDAATIKLLLTLPAVFAYEHAVEAPARVGRITSIREASSGDLRIEFEFADEIPPIEPSRIAELEWELDIDGWEMNRTHWAIKDVDLASVLEEPAASPTGLPTDAPDLDLTGVIESLERLESLALSVATGGSVARSDWEEAKDALLNGRIAPLLPSFVRTCTTPHQLFRLSQSWGGYSERRDRISEAFATTRDRLQPNREVSGSVAAALEELDSAYVSEQWRLALDRVVTDPDGAITLARSFLESVLKHILDDLDEAHSGTDTLPGLFRAVTGQLVLAPEQQSETEFRKLLGGATTIVDATAAIRNRLGDAHGRGRGSAQAHRAHAELAVNTAGSIAVFLLARWEEARES